MERLSQDAEETRSGLTGPPALLARGLTKSYGSTVGVSGVDLEVRQGERFGFLGPNGAGKTTFIRLALGLLRPSQGRVEVMGLDMARDRLTATEQVGYLPGELGLIGNVSGLLTLDTLAALHPRPPERRAELLDVLELSRDDLDRHVREYSRGMKQKLGLVAALQHDPPLMILDEPTGGLDPVVQDRLIEWLRARCAAGRTLFFSSHILSEVEQLCQRVGMIRGGELVKVLDVHAVRRSGGRVVTVIFRRNVSPDEYRVPQLSGQVGAGTDHRFVIHGDPGPLLERLSTLPVEDITIEPPRLEDLFRTTYTGESEE